MHAASAEGRGSVYEGMVFVAIITNTVHGGVLELYSYSGVLL